MGKLMATKDFRIALSHAINRDQIKEIGVPRPGRGAPGRARAVASVLPGRRVRQEVHELRRAEANKMLDGIGLTKKDAQRHPPAAERQAGDASRSRVVPAFGAWPDVAQLVAKDWEKVGIKTIVQIRERALHFKMRDTNELMTEIWNEDTTAFPFTGNAKVDPRNSAILTTGHRCTASGIDTGGKEGVEPTPEIKKIVEMIDNARTVGPDEQIKAAQEIFKIWADQLYEIGIVGLTPMVQGVVVVNNKITQRAHAARQRLAAAHAGQRPPRAVLLHEVTLHRRLSCTHRDLRRCVQSLRLNAGRLMTRYILQPLAAAAVADGDLLVHHLRDHPGAARRLPDRLCRPRWPRRARRSARSRSRRLRAQYGLDQPIRRAVLPLDGSTCSTAISACRSNTSAPTPS